MTVGRKPKPTALKLITGNPGKRAINKAEPVVSGAICEPHEWLTDDQKKIWRDATSNAPDGLLKSLDASVFCAWVVAYDLHRQAAQKVAVTGTVIKTKDGNYIQSPWLAIVNRQAQIMIKAAEQLGFSPSARSRVTVEKKKEASRFSEFTA